MKKMTAEETRQLLFWNYYQYCLLLKGEKAKLPRPWDPRVIWYFDKTSALETVKWYIWQVPHNDGQLNMTFEYLG